MEVKLQLKNLKTKVLIKIYWLKLEKKLEL